MNCDEFRIPALNAVIKVSSAEEKPAHFPDLLVLSSSKPLKLEATLF